VKGALIVSLAVTALAVLAERVLVDREREPPIGVERLVAAERADALVIAALRVSRPGDGARWTLARKSGLWRVVDGTQAVCDSRAIEALVSRVLGARALLRSAEAADRRAYGLAPAAEWKLELCGSKVLSSPDGDVLFALDVGRSLAPRACLAERAGEPQPLELDFERSVNYAAPPANNPGQGVGYFYSTPKRLIINVQVYDLGRRVPAGSDNPTVIAQFNAEVASAEQQFKFGGYTQFQKPSVPSTCTYGAVSFRCVTYSGVTQANSRVFSRVLLTGFRDHFVKIRIDWAQSHQQTAADADAALQAFVPALMR
jgi:hypothetical protein